MTAELATDPLTRTIASSQTLKLAALPSESILYTPVEQRFERITRLTAKLLRVPVAAITLFHQDEEWFKSVQGWEVRKLSVAAGFGAIAAQARDLVVIPDTAEDPRTRAHALVTSAPGFRFFAGMPLFERDGGIIGTLSVMDMRPKPVSEVDAEAIRDLCAITQGEILTDQISSAQAALSAKLGAARREALIDPLTRVWNRRGGNMALKTAFAEADAAGISITISLIDIDRFKTINDTYGHDVGDIVLRKIAETLVGNMREHDIVCRLGGDEFLLILYEADTQTAGAAIERIRRSLADSPLRTRHGDVTLTVSCGYVVRGPGSDKTYEELILLADQALMSSKAAGRNRVAAAPSPANG
jgi:diguanylate cyclase (GGDEF)-like protein